MRSAREDIKKIVRIQEEIVEILASEKTLPLEKATEALKERIGVSGREVKKAIEELERGFIVERRREGCREQLVYRLSQ